MKTVSFSGDDIEAMETALAASDRTNSDALFLHFALGKAHEDARRFDVSFSHYRAGNALKRERVFYDPSHIEDFVSETKRCFTREFFASRSAFGCPDPSPIFIVGLPRSGSTLVEQILASHSQVEGTMELEYVMDIARGLGATLRRSTAAQLSRLAPDQLRVLGEAYLARTLPQRRLGRPFFIDKMPSNFLHIGLIQLMLPNAKIIDVRRRPMACCFSVFKQLFPSGHPYSCDLTDIARYQRTYVELMAHVDRVLPGRVHRVSYESLVTDPDRQVRALLDYCGLEFQDSCLRFYENDRGVRTASSEQVRRPIFTDGLEQWRNYEYWLDELRTALG